MTQEQKRIFDGAFALGSWPDEPTSVSLHDVGAILVTLEGGFAWTDEGTIKPLLAPEVPPHVAP